MSCTVSSVENSFLMFCAGSSRAKTSSPNLVEIPVCVVDYCLVWHRAVVLGESHVT